MKEITINGTKVRMWAQLDKQGIVHGIRSKQDLEECTSAYKDIHQVLKDEEDLVKPIVKLQPIAVLKG